MRVICKIFGNGVIFFRQTKKQDCSDEIVQNKTLKQRMKDLETHVLGLLVTSPRPRHPQGNRPMRHRLRILGVPSNYFAVVSQLAGLSLIKTQV